MRVYRLVILIILAGLTVILLGTAVYALQTPLPPAPIIHQEEWESPTTAVYASHATLPSYQDTRPLQNEP
jgi:hypothetical protein